MTIALGLLVAAVVLGVAAPVYLRTAATPNLRPGLALAGWVSSAAMMVVAALGAAVLLAVPRAEGIDGLIGMAGSCVNILRGGEVVVEHVVRLGVAGVIVGLAARTTVIAVRQLRQHGRWRREHLMLLRSVCRREQSVLWVEEAKPIAYSVGGRHGAIVATSGLRRLGASRCDAVLAHERAHLRGRHHMLMLAADILAAALPFVPLARRAPGAIRILAELAADASAARSHGPGLVHSALLAVSQGGGTPVLAALGPQSGTLEMSREAVEARLAWLSADRVVLRRLPVRVDYALGAALTALPTVASVAGVATLVALYCVGVTG